MLKSEERGSCYTWKEKKNPKNVTICCTPDMSDQGLRLSKRNLHLFFSTSIMGGGLDSTRWNLMQEEYPSLFLYARIHSSYITENMREVLVRAMCHFIFQIWLSLWEFWTARNTGRNLAVLGCCTVRRATAARSNLDGPVSQTHYEQEAASWVWMARVVSKRERVIRWAVKTWNPQNSEHYKRLAPFIKHYPMVKM